MCSSFKQGYLYIFAVKTLLAIFNHVCRDIIIRQLNVLQNSSVLNTDVPVTISTAVT